MKLIDIYNKIANPIENIEIIKRLIKIYMVSSDEDSLYLKLTNKESIEANSAKEIDLFYSILFNEWKKNIIEMSFKRFSNLLKNEKYKKDFSKMREFLEKVPDVKTKEAVDKIIYGKYKGKDDEIAETLKTYYWINTENSEWEYVHSKLITIKKYNDPIVEYNLYLNIDNSHVYGMAAKFIEKCIEYEIPYYFKVDKTGKKIDNIIIGCDSEHLMLYIKILDEIKREVPEFIVGKKEHSLLTGRLASWLGFGSEPDNKRNYKGKEAFYYIRAKELEESIGIATNEWIKSHKEDSEFKENTASLIIKLMKENSSNEHKLQGLEENELSEVLLESMDGLFEDYYANNSQGIDINNLESGDLITVSRDDLRLCIRRSSVEIAKDDEEYLENVKEEIIKNCVKYGIDSEKYCFNMNSPLRSSAQSRD